MTDLPFDELSKLADATPELPETDDLPDPSPEIIRRAQELAGTAVPLAGAIPDSVKVSLVGHLLAGQQLDLVIGEYVVRVPADAVKHHTSPKPYSGMSVVGALTEAVPELRAAAWAQYQKLMLEVDTSKLMADPLVVTAVWAYRHGLLSDFSDTPATAFVLQVARREMEMEFYRSTIALSSESPRKLYELLFPSAASSDLDLMAQLYLTFAPEKVGVATS